MPTGFPAASSACRKPAPGDRRHVQLKAVTLSLERTGAVPSSRKSAEPQALHRESRSVPDSGSVRLKVLRGPAVAVWSGSSRPSAGSCPSTAWSLTRIRRQRRRHDRRPLDASQGLRARLLTQAGFVRTSPSSMRAGRPLGKGVVFPPESSRKMQFTVANATLQCDVRIVLLSVNGAIPSQQVCPRALSDDPGPGGSGIPPGGGFLRSRLGIQPISGLAGLCACTEAKTTWLQPDPAAVARNLPRPAREVAATATPATWPAMPAPRLS